MQNWKVRHLGFIVRDIEASTKYFLSTGLMTLGPSMTLETPERGGLKVQFLNFGPLEYELFQPLSSDSLQAVFLEQHGEGVQHVAFEVDDIEQEIAAMSARGVKMLFRSTADNGSKIAYFDTGAVGDFMVELVQPAK